MFNIPKTSESEKRQLVDRARLLGNWWVQDYIETGTEGMIRILTESVSQPPKRLDVGTESRLFAEMLAFYLHFADRVALGTLDNEKREIFMEALFETTQSAAAKCERADFVIQEIFDDFYATFEREHYKLKLDESSGGEGRLLWEFGKKLSNIANSKNGPIKEPFHLVMIERLLLKSVSRLCLPTLMNPKKTLDEWSKDLENAEKVLNESRKLEQNIKQALDKLAKDKTQKLEEGNASAE